MGLVINGNTEKKIDAVLDNVDDLIREVRGKLLVIDATVIEGILVALNETVINLREVSKNLKSITDKFK